MSGWNDSAPSTTRKWDQGRDFCTLSPHLYCPKTTYPLNYIFLSFVCFVSIFQRFMICSLCSPYHHHRVNKRIMWPSSTTQGISSRAAPGLQEEYTLIQKSVDQIDSGCRLLAELGLIDWHGPHQPLDGLAQRGVLITSRIPFFPNRGCPVWQMQKA